MPSHLFIIVVLTALFHAVWNFAAKKVSGSYAVMYIGLVMATIGLIPTLFFVPELQLFRLEKLPYVVLSGFAHAFYFTMLSKAYTHGDISIMYPIARGSGIAGTAIAAALIFNEVIPWEGALGIALVGIGTIVTGIKRSPEKQYRKGLFYAFLVGASIMAYAVVDKWAVDQLHPIEVLYGFTFFMTLILTPYAFLNLRPQLHHAWKNLKRYSLLIGVGSLSSYLIILYVFQQAPISFVVAVREVAIVFGALLGFIFLKEAYSHRRLIGILLILVGIIIIKSI